MTGRYKLIPAVADTNAAARGLSRLDAAVSSRSTPARILAAPANPLATDAAGRVTVAANADKIGYSLNLAQAVPTSNRANTVGGALNGAHAQSFGKWVRSGTTPTLLAPDGSTPVRVLRLDDPLTPAQRV